MKPPLQIHPKAVTHLKFILTDPVPAQEILTFSGVGIRPNFTAAKDLSLPLNTDRLQRCEV
ncbi:MAG: hypothetical protein FP819_26985 [Rhizobiaceae bacterium]|nr:hypothetical protein [Rhizobiaceae bacterium]